MYWEIYDNYTIRSIKPKTDKSILIRILEPQYKNYGIPYKIHSLDKYIDVLELYFDDIVEIPPEEYKNRFVLFNNDMAKQLTDFIITHDFEEINVHCNGGQSRSAAIMICISKILDRKDIEESINKDSRFKPNKLVLNIFDDYFKTL